MHVLFLMSDKLKKLSNDTVLSLIDKIYLECEINMSVEMAFVKSSTFQI